MSDSLSPVKGDSHAPLDREQIISTINLAVNEFNAGRYQQLDAVLAQLLLWLHEDNAIEERHVLLNKYGWTEESVRQ
jgi:AmiR/NasT family two-component response regulator